MLVGHIVQGYQGQRDEQQPEPGGGHQHRAEQLAWVGGVFGQPGEPEHPACGHGGAARISSRAPVRGISREASVAAVTIPAVNGR